MTRINSHINPKYLTDEHLLAEHREIKRVPACLSKTVQSKHSLNIPGNFCLGAGHVKFFYNKFTYLKNRYCDIHNECLLRGFSVDDYSNNFDVDNQYCHDYPDNQHDNDLVKNRIIDRIQSSTKSYFHYYGKPITKNEAIMLLGEV